MKTTKAFIRAIALMAVFAMLLGFGGCIKTYNDDPTVIKCGSVKIGLQRFLTAFQNSDYYQYYQQGYIDASTYSDYVVNELTSYGVQLDQAKKQGFTLTDDDKAEIQSNVDDAVKSYLEQNYASAIDSTITDETAKYDAEMELFLKDLKSNGSSLKKYRADLEESYTNSALINKLRDSVIGDITVNNEDVQKYFDDNLNTSTTIANFNTAFSNFVSGASSSIPSYMPVVKAAEADDEAEDEEGDSSSDDTALTEYDAMFSVLHLLLKFDEEAGSDVTDLAAYAEEQDKEFTTSRSFVEDKIATLDAQQFIDDLCFNEDVCDDPGMLESGHQFFGYIMSEQLIDSYYEGFGNAAMMLKYPDWQPKTEETDDADADADDAEETPEVDHGYTRMTLSDGTEIMRVYTTAGIHYIILNPNNWNCMYGEDGKLLAPIYDGDELVKDGDSIVTTAGNITKEVFDTIEDALSHIGDKDSEDFVATTCKSLYDIFNNGALTTAQNEVYTAKFNEWKEATKITVKNKIIKTLTTGV